jgi:hypothetical protein
MQNFTPAKVSVFDAPTMTMNSDILNREQQKKDTEIDLGKNLGVLVTNGIWKPESTTALHPAESNTPHLLSSSNSVTFTLSPVKEKGKRAKKRRSQLFRKRLTLKSFGVNPVALSYSNRGYSLPYDLQSSVETRRLPSQDVLALNSLSSKVNHSNDKSTKENVPSEKISGRSPKKSVHFASSPPTLTQLKRALKNKLLKARENRPSKRRQRRAESAPQPDSDRGQEVEIIEMNTGTLYLYQGGDLPRKAVFIRNR